MERLFRSRKKHVEDDGVREVSGNIFSIEGDYRLHYELPEGGSLKLAVSDALGISGLWEQPYVLHYQGFETEIRPEMTVAEASEALIFAITHIQKG